MQVGWVRRFYRHQYCLLCELEVLAEAEYSDSQPGREGRLAMAEVMRRTARELFEIQYSEHLKD